MSKGILLVGGRKHGQRMILPPGHSTVNVAEYSRDYFASSPGPLDTMSATTTVYTRERVGMGRRSMPFMRHESLSSSTAAEAALDILFTEAGGSV